MKHLSTIILFVIVLFSCKRHNGKISSEDYRFATDTIDGIYIPYDIDDCMAQLDVFIADSTKTEIMNMTELDFLGLSHFGIGIWMRNNWRLWGGSRLSKYFNERGIYHPDDMSGIIVKSYYRHLKGLSLDVEKQIESSLLFWKVTGEPGKESFPENVKKIEIETKYYYKHNDDDDYSGCLQVIRKQKTDNHWLYDYHYGWKKTDESELLMIDEKAPLSKEFVKNTFEK